MKLMISGSRYWTNEDIIKRVLLEVQPTEVIVGDANGADKITRKLCKRYGITYTVFKADWARHGRAAGPVRNRKMIDSKPDILYAFPLGESKGTYNAIKLASEARIRTIVYTGDD